MDGKELYQVYDDGWLVSFGEGKEEEGEKGLELHLHQFLS